MAHKLLIVDDEPKIYHALRRALHREKDWTTLYADGGDAALKVLEKEDVDVVISDENMPGMNGTQLLGLVRQKWPDVIRMMLTGDPSIETVMNAVNRGEIYRFFTKPCNEAELIISIRDAMQMKGLAHESRRLLETVKRQAVRIRDLETGERGDAADTAGDRRAAAMAQDGESKPTQPPASADQATPKSERVAQPSGAAGSDEVAGPTMSLDQLGGGGSFGVPPKREEIIDLDEEGLANDVDDLLSEIRSQLDELDD